MRKIESQEMLWFGNYANVPIEEIPQEYLEWAVDTWDAGTRQYEIVEQELIRRKNFEKD